MTTKIPDDVVEKAVKAYGECGAGFHESFRAAGEVFVEWGRAEALEEAAAWFEEQGYIQGAKDIRARSAPEKE